MLENKNIGFGITGSFCSMDDMLSILTQLVAQKCNVYVFISETLLKYDTRFNTSDELINKIKSVVKNDIVSDIVGAEIFGPQIPLDLMVVYPCTANTLSKLAHGLNDTAVTMAVKSTLRNNKNVVLAIYSNDALSNSGKNIMQMLNTKNYYLNPMYQDDIVKKPFSMIADKSKTMETIIHALDNHQLQPVFEGDISG